MQTVRDVLARRGRQPVIIERTDKRPGDKVLHSWALPAEHHRSSGVRDEETGR